jgi:thiamine kinase-like enzyme
MRLERGTIGQADMHAGKFGIGPKVYYAGKAGLVMDRLSGRTLTEVDIHKGDFRLLGAIADVLARCHQLPPPPVFAPGVPLVWREIDKMMDVAARRPELIPKDMPDIDTITSEINSLKTALEKYNPKLVFAHGSMNPSNVMMSTDGNVRLIDFELGGPNYRGFDLMKLFRTAGVSNPKCMTYFLRVYTASVSEMQNKDDATLVKEASALMDEVRMFEPLTWLEAAVFFLVMSQFKPQGASKWNELASHRWAKFKETRSLVA